MADRDATAPEGLRSPCIGICQIHPRSRLCIGCLRTIDEIAGWSNLPDHRRSRILRELPKRASADGAT